MSRPAVVRRATPSGSPFLQLIRRRWRVIGVLTTAAVLVTVVASLLQTPRFQSTAVVLVKTLPTIESAGEFIIPARLGNEVALALSGDVVGPIRTAFGDSVRIDVRGDATSSVLRFSADHPDATVAAAVANMHAEGYLTVRLERQVAAYLAAADVVRARVEDVDAQLSDVERRFLAQRATDPEANDLEARFAAERAPLEAQRRRYLETLDRLSLAAELAATGETTVLDRAAASDRPSSPNIVRNIALALFGGLASALVLAAGIDVLDDRIRSRDDVPLDDAAVPLLATIARIPKVRDGSAATGAMLPARDAPRSPTAEAFRALGTSLAFLRLERPLNIIQITSPLSGDGKTTTATNLAVSLARGGDDRVLLIDADLLRPRAHEAFGVERGPGLAEILTGQATFEDVVQDVPGQTGLSVLPAGSSRPEMNAELLRSQGFRTLLSDLREEFALIIVDTPPVLAVSDPLVVSEAVDGLVLVLAAGTTRRRQVGSALDLLNNVGAPLIGMILNGLQDRGPAGYGYGYGYGYGGPAVTGRRPGIRGRGATRPPAASSA
jgi:succinoglycan biosynthesis transport protein ExoP